LVSARLKSIYIKSFRRIEECEVDGFRRFNVFIGRNGSGKSTILDSIYTASSWVSPGDNILALNRMDYVIARRSGRGRWADSRSILWFKMDVFRKNYVQLIN